MCSSFLKGEINPSLLTFLVANAAALSTLTLISEAKFRDSYCNLIGKKVAYWEENKEVWGENLKESILNASCRS